MQKLLIPFTACLLLSAALHAQVPHRSSFPQPIDPKIKVHSAESVCNDAGTFILTNFGGQSNDTDLDTVFLCLGDSILVNHNGDFDLSGDPNPATPPGIAYAFYTCPPTVIGDNLAAILTDPCAIVSTSGQLIVSEGTANGDTWFINDGSLQNSIQITNELMVPLGSPILLHFAPITLDDFATEGFEAGGNCVNVNTADAFAVVYLNAISVSGIDNMFGNDCLGKFRIRGGFPEWSAGSTYTVTITSVVTGESAIIHTSQAALTHGADVFFSAPVSGPYNVTIEDGKSCGFTTVIDMTTCDPSDNVIYTMDSLIVPQGSSICMPITVNNFSINNIATASFSLQWDELILEFDSVTNVHPQVVGFNPANNLNVNQTDAGQLGVALYNSTFPGDTLVVADGDTLLSVCFTAIGPWETCSGINVINSPAQVTVEDINGIQYALTVNPGQICIDTVPLNLIAQVVNPTCQIPATASIQVQAIGGVAPYDVYIRNTAGGPVFNPGIPTYQGTVTQSNLQSGTYEVCIVDQNGTNLADSVCTLVTINTQTLGASLDLTGLPTCNGLSNGSVTANVLFNNTIVPNPDTADFEFVWSSGPSIVQGQPVQVNVPAGQYFVTITDNTTGCTAVAGGTLPNPPVISQDELNITTASCTGICDGSISYLAQGGTPFPNGEYNYNWEYTPTVGGAPSPFFNGVADTSNLTALCAGFYFVTVTDANGCTYVEQAEIEVQNLRTLTIQQNALNGPGCAGDTTGQICIELVADPPYGGGAAYSFFWGGGPAGPYPQVNNGAQSCLNSLPAGAYNVAATETTTGCVATATFEVADPPVLTLATTNVTNPTCTFQNDGTITVAGSGGTGLNTYLYNWGCDTTGTGPTMSALEPGTYCVTVSDANGCTAVDTIALMLPPPPAINGFDSTSVQCGSDGCLTVQAPTGATFVWTNTADSVLQTGNLPQICDLPGGTYIVVVIDAADCVNSDTVSLAAVDALAFTPNVTYTQPTCFGYNNGSITVEATGGTPGYSFSWDTGQSGASVDSLEAGVHTVTLTDSQGCTVIDTFVLQEPPSIGASQNNISPATCFSTCDGAVTIDAFYNTTPTPTPGSFSFNWDDGGTGASRTDLCPGDNIVTITDDNGCFREETVSISSPPQVTTSATATPVTCFGDDNGTASAIGGGGNGGPFTYAWATIAGGSVGTGSPINDLAAGDYVVTVSDQDGCTGVDTVTVTTPEAIVVTVDATDIECFGDLNGSVAASATGGNTAAGPYTYTWQDDNGTAVGSSANVPDLGAGNYFVTVSDALGCTGSFGPATIIEPPMVIGAIAPLDTIECFGGEVDLIIDTIYGGHGGPYLFSLDGGPQLDSNYYNALQVNGGEHFVTYYDQQLCAITDTFTVVEPEPITVTFNPAEIEIELGDTTTQLDPIIGGVAENDIVTISWTPLELLRFDPDRSGNDSLLHPFVNTYETENFTLTVIDPNGCQGSGTVVINVDANRNVYVPNVFKPGNNINENDHFVPQTGLGVKKINYMRVYDRWGSLLYSNDNLPVSPDRFTDGWDGRHRGKFVDPGVYVYVIEIEFLDDRVLLYRGDVTVLR
jgi:hypothetical protein